MLKLDLVITVDSMVAHLAGALGCPVWLLLQHTADWRWMQDRADPHSREQALCIAQENPPFDVSPEQAIAAVRDVLDSIGDTCPDCPPEDL